MGVFIMKLIIYNQFPFINFIFFIIQYKCPKEGHYAKMDFVMQKVSHLSVHLPPSKTCNVKFSNWDLVLDYQLDYENICIVIS
jgi:hypothetical protein